MVHVMTQDRLGRRSPDTIIRRSVTPIDEDRDSDAGTGGPETGLRCLHAVTRSRPGAGACLPLSVNDGLFFGTVTVAAAIT